MLWFVQNNLTKSKSFCDHHQIIFAIFCWCSSANFFSCIGASVMSIFVVLSLNIVQWKIGWTIGAKEEWKMKSFIHWESTRRIFIRIWLPWDILSSIKRTLWAKNIFQSKEITLICQLSTFHTTNIIMTNLSVYLKYILLKWLKY